MAAAVQPGVTAWAPNSAPQEALLSCPIADVFYGGARGGGKTDGLLGDFAAHAGKYGQHARGALFRRTRTPELEEVIARSHEIYGPLGWTYHEQKHTWTAPNGATLRLRYLERDADANLYQGHNYTWLGFDEAGNWPSPIPLDKLLATLRSAHGVPCVRRLTGNPGGVGHHWLKARYITPARPYTVHRYQPQPESLPDLWVEAVFIPSTLDDNPALRGTGYETNIAAATAGNTALWQAWRYGNWDVVAGAAFSEWRSDLHVLRSFNPPQHWLPVGGFDGGIRHQSWLGLGALGPEGDLVTCYEWYWQGKDYEIAGYDVGRAMLGITDLVIGPELLIATDDAQFNNLGIGGRTQATDFQSGLKRALGPRAPTLVAVGKGKGSRVQRVALAHQMLRWEEAEDGTVPPRMRPKARFHQRCEHLIRTLPALPVDPDNLEDVDTDAEDHPFDGWSYMVKLNTAPPEAPVGQPQYQDRERGWHRDGTPRRPHVLGFDEEHERHLAETEGSGFRSGMRWEPDL